MSESEKKPAASSCDIASWILMGCGLLIVLAANLLPALLAGLLVYGLINVLTRVVHLGQITGYRARVIAVAFLATVSVLAAAAAILGLVAFFRSDAGSLTELLTKLANIVQDFQKYLPSWAVDQLPDDTDGVRASIVTWLEAHASELKTIGSTAGRVVTYIVIGMIIGAMVSLRRARNTGADGPLAKSLIERVAHLSSAFQNVVFAQVRIAAINAFFTAMYLAVLLPIMNVELPLIKTMVAITFVVGLIPVLGNLLSNTVIIMVSLSHSPPVAVGSLCFLVIIHKLEYFLNAKIVGSRIKAHAWELLIAMLAMEVMFGIPGIIAAPIFYAYVKEELVARNLI